MKKRNLKNLSTILTFIFFVSIIGDFGKVFAASLSNVFIETEYGICHFIGLKADGTVWTHGDNHYNELGYSTNNQSTSEPKKVDGISDVKQISTFGTFNELLKNDGTVWYFGKMMSSINSEDTSFIASSDKPAQISGVSGIKQISASMGISAFLKNDGTVLLYGNKKILKKFDPSISGDMNESAIASIGGIDNVKQVSANPYSILFLKEDGTVWQVGYDINSEIQYNFYDYNNYNPVPFKVDGLSDVKKISSNLYNSMFLKNDGTVYAAGIMYDLLEDYYDEYENSYKLHMIQGMSDVTDISAGSVDEVMLKNDGTVWGIGENYIGELGADKNQVINTPVEIKELKNSKYISAGFLNIASIKTDNSIAVSGMNLSDKVNDLNNTPSVSHMDSIPLLKNISQVVARSIEETTNHGGTLETNSTGERSAVLDGNGDVYTFGKSIKNDDNNKYLFFQSIFLPKKVTAANNVKMIGLTNSDLIMLKNDGTVWGLGGYSYGYFGDDSVSDSRINPVKAQGLDNVKTIAVSNSHVIALKNDGTVWTMGNYSSKIYKIVGNIEREYPEQIPGLNNVVAMAAGETYSAFLKSDGTVVLYGDLINSDSLFNLYTNFIEKPVCTSAKAIAGGKNHLVILKNDGTVWSVGSNKYGQLGNETNTDSSVPVQVNNISSVKSVFAADYGSFAVKTDGSVYAFGKNDSGNLGTGTDQNTNMPMGVNGIVSPSMISGSDNHTLALMNDGTVSGSGSGILGQLAWPCIQSFTYDFLIPALSCSKDSQEFSDPLAVSLSSSKGNVYYTIDGSEPTVNSSKYTQPLNISNTTTLKCIAVDSNGNISDTLVRQFTYANPALNVSIDGIEENGTYFNEVTPKITVNHSDAVIDLSLDGKTISNNKLMGLGKHTLTINVSDKFSNKFSKDIHFEIKPELTSNETDIDDIVSYCGNSENNNIIIPMSNTSKVTKKILTAIKNSGNVVSFIIVQNGYDIIWTFDGKDIDPDNIKDIDLGLSSSSPNDASILKLDSGAQILSFASNGVLPCPVTIKIKADTSKINLSKEIYLYYYNPRTGNVELCSSGIKADGDGYVQFTIKHYSEYFITNNKASSSGTNANKSSNQASIPKTGSFIDTKMLGFIGGIMIISGFILLFPYKRKRS